MTLRVPERGCADWLNRALFHLPMLVYFGISNFTLRRHLRHVLKGVSP
ncbi:MAG TPA: hypothetical protein VFC44_13900 [Candidatus Saccharimonadales bacterium]|nr:hypothetical protein [Candidatus Saccharimonadales bacterium]